MNQESETTDPQQEVTPPIQTPVEEEKKPEPDAKDQTEQEFEDISEEVLFIVDDDPNTCMFNAPPEKQPESVFGGESVQQALGNFEQMPVNRPAKALRKPNSPTGGNANSPPQKAKVINERIWSSKEDLESDRRAFVRKQKQEPAKVPRSVTDRPVPFPKELKEIKLQEMAALRDSLLETYPWFFKEKVEVHHHHYYS